MGLFAESADILSAGSALWFNADDSVFRWFLLERHDTSDPYGEGVFVTVWAVARGWG